MGLFPQIEKWFCREAATISLKRCTSIDVNIKNSSITASPALKVTVVLEPFPDPDAPQNFPVCREATLEDKQRFTPPDHGSGLLCGRNTCGEPMQRRREQGDCTQRGPDTGNQIHNMSQYECWSVPEMGGVLQSDAVANELLKMELATYHVISNHCISSMSKITISMYANSGTFTSLLLLTWQLIRIVLIK